MSANSVAVVALDLHKKFTRAVTMDPGGEVVDDRRVHHADHSEFERFFREFERGTDVVMEATFNWPWVADLAEKCGLKPHLGDPMRITDFRKGLPKSDRKDCIAEGSLWLRKMFPEAYLAPVGVRRMRALFRMRGLFVKMRTALKRNVHGQLFRLGVLLEEESSIFSLKGRAALKLLDLDEAERTELSRKFALLGDLSFLRRLADTPDSTAHMASSSRVGVHKRYRPRGLSSFVLAAGPDAGVELHDHERSFRFRRDLLRRGRRIG